MLHYQTANKSMAVYDYNDFSTKNMKPFGNTLAKAKVNHRGYNNQFRVLKLLRLGKIVCFGNFARTVTFCLGFHLRTLYDCCVH